MPPGSWKGILTSSIGIENGLEDSLKLPPTHKISYGAYAAYGLNERFNAEFSAYYSDHRLENTLSSYIERYHYAEAALTLRRYLGNTEGVRLSFGTKGGIAYGAHRKAFFDKSEATWLVKPSFTLAHSGKAPGGSYYFVDAEIGYAAYGFNGRERHLQASLSAGLTFANQHKLIAQYFLQRCDRRCDDSFLGSGADSFQLLLILPGKKRSALFKRPISRYIGAFWSQDRDRRSLFGLVLGWEIG